MREGAAILSALACCKIETDGGVLFGILCGSQRMQQYLAHEASVHNKPASNQFLRQATTLSPSDVALGFLVRSIDALHRQIESAEARVEQAVAESTKAASLIEKELLGEEMVELLEMNEDRTWHVERLERVQRLLENEEVSAEKVMDLQNAITYFIESNDVRLRLSPSLIRSQSDADVCSGAHAGGRVHDRYVPLPTARSRRRPGRQQGNSLARRPSHDYPRADGRQGDGRTGRCAGGGREGQPRSR